MKTRLLRVLLLALCAFVLSNARAQETPYSTGGNNYYSINFDDGLLHSFSNVSTANTITFTAAASNNLDPTIASGQCLQTGSVSGDGSTYNSILGTGVNLNNNTYEWSILYQTTYDVTKSSSYNNIVNLTSTTPSTGQAGWRFWLNCMDKVPTSASQGVYLQQVGNVIYLMIQYSYGPATIISYTLPTPTVSNPVYNIKVQRSGSSPIWYMAINECTVTAPEAHTQVGYNQSSVSAFNTYYYTVLETNSKTGTAGTFKFDDIKLYTATLNAAGNNTSSSNINQNPYLTFGGTYCLFGFSVTSRGLYNFDEMRVKSTGTGSAGNMAQLFSSFTLYASSSPIYSSSAVPIQTIVNTTNDFTQPAMRFNSANQNYYNSTPGTIYYFLVGTVVSASTVSNSQGAINVNSTVSFDITAGGQYDSDGLLISSGNSSPYSTYIDDNTWAASNPITYYFTYGYDWGGSNGTGWITPGNWYSNGQQVQSIPGANDNVRIGVVAYKGSNQPTLPSTGAQTVNNIEFGKLGSTNTTNNAKVTLNLTSNTLTVNNGVNFDAAADVLMGTAGTMTIKGTSSMASTSILEFTSGAATTLTTSGTFTLLSDASGSAQIGPMLNGPTFTVAASSSGTFNVQRYLTGNRAYRLLSSPVYTNTTASTPNYYNLNYVKASAFVSGTGGTANGFDVTHYNNPTIYLYNGSVATSNTTFNSGNFKGVESIKSGSNSITVNGPITLSNGIPVGNGFMFFYVGDNVTNYTAKGQVSVLAEALSLGATGSLNQGTIPVYLWYNTNTTLNAAQNGYNLIGNPYPCTIDWDSNSWTAGVNGKTAGITLSNTKITGTGGATATGTADISTQIYVYNATKKIYSAFTAATSDAAGVVKGESSDANGSSRYIASGQAFFITATKSGATLIFNENAKAPSSQLTGAGLMLNTVNNNSDSQNSIMHLRLESAADSLSQDNIGIYFTKGEDPKFVLNDDAADMDAALETVFLSSYTSDNVRVTINQMPALTGSPVTVKLYTKVTTSGLYQLKKLDMTAIPSYYKVYLKDNLLNDSLDMTHYNSYGVNIDASNSPTDRFQLDFIPEQLNYSLISFTGQNNNNKIDLNWKMSNEQDYISFVLQKKDSNGVFSTISTSQSTGIGSYNYTDASVVNGNNTYRLQLTDVTGNTTYSNILNIIVGTDSSGFSIYPNPASSMINVNLLVNVPASGYTETIYDLSGKTLIKRTVSGTTWSENISDLKAGTYIMELYDPATDIVIGYKKLIKTN